MVVRMEWMWSIMDWTLTRSMRDSFAHQATVTELGFKLISRLIRFFLGSWSTRIFFSSLMDFVQSKRVYFDIIENTFNLFDDSIRKSLEAELKNLLKCLEIPRNDFEKRN
ncbi:hypothetical protein BpHYR1_053659 [Brachionus plicatilis]|uniref:Uncharacterized protein n=1 Tax=Brachionus plicatilis TaxID=10195 RepID=A0A3M7QUQ2_BRAPC|nr:hypothetical protein BpHYR1_053659 [Brachionus plicatilis]